VESQTPGPAYESVGQESESLRAHHLRSPLRQLERVEIELNRMGFPRGAKRDSS